MHIKQYILILISLLLLSCQKDSLPFGEDTNDNKPYVVGFWAGGSSSGNTRTTINDDGQSVSWQKGDNVALWASQGGSYTFQNQPFNLWFRTTDNSQAFFTSTLVSAMPAGEYTYYACYPLPSSVSGTTATFNLPTTQDGKMGGGADIMVTQGTGPALAKLYIPEPKEGETIEGDPNYVLDQNRLSLNMHHLIHALRFYVPQGKWGFPQGETIECIVLTTPQNIAGSVTTDVAKADGLALNSNGSKSITLSLAEDLVASTSGDMNYAVAAILPPSANYGEKDEIEVTVYTQKRYATQKISLNGRGPQATNEKMRMAAGRVTPVGLDCSVPSNPKVSFRIKSNNLEEEPYRITLESVNTNAKWKSGDDYVYEYYTGSENKTIPIGGGFEFDSDFESISTIWGKQVKVTYESKSAIVTKTIDMPEMELKTNYIVELDVPYLFAENFEGWDPNNDHWETTEKDLSSINGWSGNQWKTNGINMGLCSYVFDYASWYFTTLSYGRIDSPIIPLKKGVKVKLKVSFNVSMEDPADNGNTGCIYGFSTSNKVGGYTGSSVSGHNRNTPDYPVGDEITYDGSNYSDSIAEEYEFDSTPENLRLTWFADINRKKNNISNRWFKVYIDDITVKIAQ